ncbi:unnamed protein product [Acanthosepion pharaonis]|uniref:Uncharacterized protein n=1 Tax=Acanthosepion pharaonis TaxID=158019 RepID=A0A812EMZ0_ACAPH|nr:unnamed protein product [Sepia pharaonis]
MTEIAQDVLRSFMSSDYLLMFIDEYSSFPDVEIILSTSARSKFFVLQKACRKSTRHITTLLFKVSNSSTIQLCFHYSKTTSLCPEANGEADRFMKTVRNCCLILSTKQVHTPQCNEAVSFQSLHKKEDEYRYTVHSSSKKFVSRLAIHRKSCPQQKPDEDKCRS